MPVHSYLHWPTGRDSSWHVLVKVDEAGWHLRCGRTITTDSARGSDHIPAGEKSCESCAVGALRDEDVRTPDNDEVTE